MEQELPFAGYHDLVKVPLETTDPASLRRINNLLLDLSGHPVTEPFSMLVKKLTGKTHSNDDARALWNAIIAHKNDMSLKLERTVSIQRRASDTNVPSLRHPSHPKEPTRPMIGSVGRMRPGTIWSGCATR
jgi:hypothetical protein